MSNHLSHTAQLFRRKFAPFAEGNALQGDVHDADPFQLGDLVAEVLAHASDLAFPAFLQDEAQLIVA